jgi:hypothetical protein
MSRLTQSSNKLKTFEFSDLGQNIELNNIANDDESGNEDKWKCIYGSFSNVLTVGPLTLVNSEMASDSQVMHCE